MHNGTVPPSVRPAYPPRLHPSALNRLSRRQLLALPLVCVGGLSACAAPDINDYRQERPPLDLRSYFNGTLDAWGMFTDRSGRIIKRFTVVMRCTWTGDDGILDEAFTYADGTQQQRIWRLRHLGDGRYEGRADDVIGVARGESRGNALRWAYTLALPVDGQVVHVTFDDWMVLMDERVMLNRAVMSKWGVTLGEVTLSFTRRI
jgi:Protein of unknown function (DUF3833)